jgi:hypothetical protein
MGEEGGRPMTEAEWLACGEPEPLLRLLQDRASQRKLRLFACACVADYIRVMGKEGTRMPAALAISEAYADGVVGREEWLRSTRLSFHFSPWKFEDVHQEARYAVEAAECVAESQEQQQQRECAFISCVFGNPFHPTVFASAWRTVDVAALAQVAYESRDFSALPILADALEDAGCTDRTILEHCRGPDPHVRGCWVLDLILGKQ